MPTTRASLVPRLPSADPVGDARVSLFDGARRGLVIEQQSALNGARPACVHAQSRQRGPRRRTRATVTGGWTWSSRANRPTAFGCSGTQAPGCSPRRRRTWQAAARGLSRPATSTETEHPTWSWPTRQGRACRCCSTLGTGCSRRRLRTRCSTTSFYDVANDLALGDLDGDGALDLMVPTDNSNSLLANVGGGAFARAGHYSSGSSTRTAALGDLDDDGDSTWPCCIGLRTP